MGLNSDIKGVRPSASPSAANALHPSISNRSKAAEAAGNTASHNIMATISDDDDRLLVRIGYTPVGDLDISIFVSSHSL